MKHQNELSIGQWLDILQGKGVLSFSVEQLKQEIVGHTDIAIKRALSRLSSMGKIVSIHKGYYLILPPQYSIKGVLPPQLYLDAFMRHLKRTYYVSLLNAAAYHGASHQQPQEYFVTTTFPVIRPTQKKGLKINYVCIKEIPLSLLEMRKTEAGYLTISNAALTACDLVQFEKRIGGLQRAVSVLEELVEVIQPTDFTTALLKHAHVTTLQRLGYLVELMGGHQALAEGLFESMKREKMTLFRIPLKSSKDAKGFSSDNRWKVIVNNEIDLDE